MQVKYLGYVVSQRGISTDPDKMEAIRSWATPNSAKEVRSFVGLCSYYRRFIAGFSDISQPLVWCAEESPFTWTPEADAVFQKLKAALTEAPVLGYPTPDDQFVVDTDASLTGVGAILSQLQDGQEKVISYYSSSLSRAERNYCATRRELLSILKAVRRFHPYLYGHPFTLCYVEDLQARLEQVHSFARTHMQLRSDSMKERYDSASNCDRLEVGDPVWLHCPQRKKGVSPKLTRQWQGPYLVTKRLNDTVYSA